MFNNAISRMFAGIGFSFGENPTAHEFYAVQHLLHDVYQYDPTDDGPECEIITRHIAKQVFYVPGAEAQAIEFSMMLDAGAQIIYRTPFATLGDNQQAQVRSEVARKYAALGF